MGHATFDALQRAVLASLPQRSVRCRTYRDGVLLRGPGNQSHRERQSKAQKKCGRGRTRDTACFRLLTYFPKLEFAEVTQASFSVPDIASHLANATLYCASRVSVRASVWASTAILCALASATSFTWVACASFTQTSFSWAALG